MFLEQAIRLVSQAPENLAYHLITLLALQVVLALALWQWRQARGDMFALRLATTAVFLLLLRLCLAVALTVVPDVSYLLIFPPLERALDLATAVFLVWAVVPYSQRAPRTNDVILIFLLLLTAVGYLIAAQDWPQWLDAGYRYYEMDHIAYWAISTLIILMGGTVWLAATRPSGWILRGLMLTPLIGAHLLNLLGTIPTEIALPTTAVPFWTRLAYLITLPLLAVVAYRHLLGSMLTGTLGSRPIGEQFATLFQFTSHVLDAPNSQQAQNQAVKLVSQVMAAKFVAVALLDADLSGNLRLVSWRPLQGDTHGRGQSESWGLKLKDWPAMQLALHQHQAVTLRPDGVGARQLFMLYQELGLPVEGSILLEPMYDVHGREFGLLLLGTPLHTTDWSADDQALLPHLAQLITRALILKQSPTSAPLPAARDNNREEIRTLTAERDLATQRALAMTDYLQQTRQELQQVEAILEGEQRRLLETQEQLELLRHQTTDDRVATLEEEIDALRESLLQAEEALAMASAGEVGLSTDWVMRTITRYSAELEALQAYTSQLELQLRQDHTAVVYRDVWPLTEALRGPLTNIAGYAELLLDESLGQVTQPQQELLQRMLKATTRLEQVLEDAVQTAEEDEPRPSLANFDTVVDVNEVVQTAVMPLMATVQEKQLTLDLTIDPALPLLHMEAESLKRILTLLLHNAALASPDHGRVRLIARPGTLHGLPQQEEKGHTTPAAGVFNYLHLVVIDSGSGIPPQWRPLVFDAQQRRTLNGTHIPGLGDQSDNLLEAQDLARMYGGRLWVDSHEKSGTAFSLLLPLPEQINEQ